MYGWLCLWTTFGGLLCKFCIIRLWKWNCTSFFLSYISYTPQQAGRKSFFYLIKLSILFNFFGNYVEMAFNSTVNLFQIDYVNSMRAAREFSSRVSDSLQVINQKLVTGSIVSLGYLHLYLLTIFSG